MVFPNDAARAIPGPDGRVAKFAVKVINDDLVEPEDGPCCWVCDALVSPSQVIYDDEGNYVGTTCGCDDHGYDCPPEYQ